MRSELSRTPGAGTAHVPGAAASRRWRGDAVAVAVLVALPVLTFGVPALLGHAVLPGDDLTQNFPLRVLAGRQIQHGQLPLFDPYIWSGAPLLAGWNAGAAYPLTFLFAMVPPTAAWTLNLIVTWTVAGLGMFAFLRALRLAALPSFLGALTFAFAGAMPAQVAHFGLVAGMSWVPVALLAVLRLSRASGVRARLGWIAVMAAAFGLTILAGEPRAIDDAGVVVFGYAAWQLLRLGRRCGPAAVSMAAGLVLGICLGAVQWLPGLAAIGTSQRAASSVALFNSGSLPHRWLLLMLVPDLLGGSGSFGQPSFLASYNLTEVTGYVGVLPLVAAVALLARVRLRPRPPEWLVWQLLALAGVILALGGNTPIGHLLVHLPLFGDQRLQSRNILVADLALAVLLAYWADKPFSGRSLDLVRTTRRRMHAETVLGVLPGLAMIAVVVLALAWGAGLLHWLRVMPGAIGLAGSLKPWLVPYALIGAGAIAFVIFGRHLPARSRQRWLGGLVAVDLVVFTLLAVVAVRPGLGGAAAATASQGSRQAGVSQAGSRRRATAPAPAVRPIAALGYPGRFGIYDPGELDPHQLSLLGPPDLNVITATPSVQGYTSIVDGGYATATGSHQATGEGQDVLGPGAIGAGVFDQLDTAVLLTPSQYLITAAGKAGPSPGPAGAGERDLAAHQRATWYLGAPVAVSKVVVPGTGTGHLAAAAARIGLVTVGGAVRWFRPAAAGTSGLAVSLPRPVPSVAVIGQAGGERSRFGPPSIVSQAGGVYVANGQLQNALQPPRWGYTGRDGPFAIFVDRFAAGPLRLEALPGRSAAGASVRWVAGAAAEPTAAAVFSPHGVRVVRAVADIPGWSAIWHPRAGRSVTLAVHRAGLVQAVDVPPGRGVVTWSYTPPRFALGLALSLAAAALILILACCRRRTAPAG